MKKLALIVLLSVAASIAAAPALAQQRPDWKGKNQGTTKDERQRMRQDMQDAYRERERQERPRQMSPQEREKLRQDIDEANRRLKR